MFMDLYEKDWIRKRYPEDVLFFEDFADHIPSDNVDDYNLLLFALLSMSTKFLTVQGGTAVTGSYFGGKNIILVKKGPELQLGDYEYFPKFSGADVVQTNTDEDFINAIKQDM